MNKERAIMVQIFLGMLNLGIAAFTPFDWVTPFNIAAGLFCLSVAFLISSKT